MITEAKSQSRVTSTAVSNLSTEILCLSLAAAILFATIYACAPCQGLSQFIKLGLNFVACACQIVPAFYFLSKNSPDANSGMLP